MFIEKQWKLHWNESLKRVSNKSLFWKMMRFFFLCYCECDWEISMNFYFKKKKILRDIMFIKKMNSLCLVIKIEYSKKSNFFFWVRFMGRQSSFSVLGIYSVNTNQWYGANRFRLYKWIKMKCSILHLIFVIIFGSLADGFSIPKLTVKVGKPKGIQFSLQGFLTQQRDVALFMLFFLCRRLPSSTYIKHHRVI